MAFCAANPKFGFVTSVFHSMPVCRLFVTVAASSKRPSRVTRSCKSNADLCKELKQFILAVGLPPNHVPSTKELSQHGRQDLANIVRRRGYKLIGELLRNLTEIEPQTETNTSAKDAFSNECDQRLRGQDDGSVPPESDFFSSKRNIHQLCSSNGVLRIKLEDNCKKGPSPSIPLNEKAASFIMTGDLESLGDTKNCKDKALSMGHDLEYSLDSVADNNEVSSQPEDLAETIAASPGEGSSISGHSAHLHRPTLFPASHPSRNELTNCDFTDSSSVEQMSLKVSGTNSQLQIDQLKVMLHQKEMELLELKQQIENEKVALSTLQAKARKEIDNSRRLVSKKDVLLNSVEENLSGLKEVHIEYHGDGSIVEVAGSFNGWLHPIRMEPRATSGIVSSSGSRLPASWSTILWLYPGVYEVKFIIDGTWKVDPQKERVMRGSIENNLIRVEG